MITEKQNPLTKLPEGSQVFLYPPGGAYVAFRYAIYWQKILEQNIDAGLLLQSITFTYRAYTKQNLIQKLLGLRPSKIVSLTLTKNQMYTIGMIEMEEKITRFSFRLDVTQKAYDTLALTNPTSKSVTSCFVCSKRYTGHVIYIHAENITRIELFKPVVEGVDLN